MGPKNIVKMLAKAKEFPTQPGVYIMRDSSGQILYVGKAKNLRSRVRSYFQGSDTLSPKTKLLVKRVAKLEFTVTHNELEALLLECNLIKKHRPRYNVRLKDDKNYPYFVLNFTHPFPQFKMTRKVELSGDLKYFGPYGAGVRELSRFLLKTFQIRDCSDAKFKNRKRPCLSYEIGTCTAPCVDYVSQDAYAKQVQEAILFLRGKKKELEKRFRQEMEEASNALAYETAASIRDKLISLRKIAEKQNMVLTEQQRDIDVVGRFISGEEIQWVILFVRAGFLTGRKAYRVKLGAERLDEATTNFLNQFYTKALVPDEIWVSEDFADRTTLEILLKERSTKKVRIRVCRNEKSLRLLGMAYENAKLLFEESNKKPLANAPSELMRVLSLPEPPTTIEGIDISNIQDKAPVGALVHFEDGSPNKQRYRLYYPKTVEGQNDFAMIHEVVTRRFKDMDNPRPDLLLIDGGKGQLSAAISALEALKIDLPICSLAKSKTRRGFTTKEVEKSQERVFIPGRKNPLALKEGNPALSLLMQIRDEVHRFGVNAHRRRRDKKMTLEDSPLMTIPGIGKKTKEKLLKEFGSVDTIAKATDADLKAAGLNKSQIQSLTNALKVKGV